MPKTISICCLNGNYFIVPCMFLLSTQFQNIKMRSCKLVIKSNARKQMAKFGFGCKFQSLYMMNLESCFLFVEFIINLKSS